MSIIATAVKHLIAAGVSGDDLVRAVAEMEADLRAEQAPVSLSPGAIRTRRWREKKEAERHGDVTVTVGDASPSLSPAPLPSPQTPQLTPHPHTHPEHTPRARKGHRLPSDWVPEPLSGEIAVSVSSWPVGAIERELARFRDWAASATGQTALKSDWQATWRNWLRRAVDEGRYQTNDRQRSPTAKPTTRESALRVAERLAASQH